MGGGNWVRRMETDRALDAVDGERGASAFENCFVHRAWRHAIAGLQLCTGQGLGRQPEAAIDNGNAGDVSPLRGESVFDENVACLLRHGAILPDAPSARLHGRDLGHLLSQIAPM